MLSQYYMAYKVITFALFPNLIVDKLSASLYSEGLHVIIKQVLVFPPSDSCNTLVNFDSR